ncbi:putative methyltransferase DDB_G0268948 isoform X2 [Pecten maximus]|nr:putative methyltransferase DDB_G0268948 isoform X2 [Pecten maximus]
MASYRLFEDEEHAKVYTKYRPPYPKALYDEIENYCKGLSENDLDLAIDVGCGSGQSTLPLTKFCKHVIGIDISNEQILQARKSATNIDFRVGSAEDLSSQGDGTVDLVTVGTAIHWLDRSIFMKEVERVLRPGGVLAVYTYGLDILHNKEAHGLVWEDLYKKTLQDCNPGPHIHIINGLSLIELPFKDSIRLEPLLVEREVDVDFYIGFIRSWSPWQLFEKKNPKTDILTVLAQRLKALYKDSVSNDVHQISLTSTTYALLGRK